MAVGARRLRRKSCYDACGTTTFTPSASGCLRGLRRDDGIRPVGSILGGHAAGATLLDLACPNEVDPAIFAPERGRHRPNVLVLGR